MAEAKEVCKICYNSTSHKPSPTLTHEPKEETSEKFGGKKKICTVCRQEWAPIRVAMELGSSRWVRIRPRPKLQMHIDFMICKNVNNRNDCPRGQDCSFAHSRAELWAWNQERQKEPRPAPTINGSYIYQMCKYMTKNGSCPYGAKCTFAHSEEELASWLKVQERHTSSLVQFKGNRQRQYAVGASRGRSSSRDRSNPPPSNHHKPAAAVTGVRRPTRPRPSVSVPTYGYRLCMHVQNGRRCLYGDYCTFAHSQNELEEWNQQIKEQGSSSRVTSKSASRESIQKPVSSIPSMNSESNKPASPGSNQTFLTTPSSRRPGDDGKDFSAAVREKIVKEYKENGTVRGQEDVVEGLRVVEVSGKELALKMQSEKSIRCIQWVFEVTTTVPHTFHSVVFFDTVNSHFSLGGVFKYGGTGAWEQLSGREAGQKHGVGLQINFKMAASDRVRVKVNVSPRSGMQGQLVVFHVDKFCIVRCCVVHRVSQSVGGADQQIVGNSQGKRPDNVDLFWEQHLRIMGLSNHMAIEDTDKHLPEFPLPPQIEEFINKGKYKNVENKVTKDNYRRRMHNLLYLEEFERRVGLSRFDLYGVVIKTENSFSTFEGGTVFAQGGDKFFTVFLEEMLLERGQTVGATDIALCLPDKQNTAHECYVEHVGKEKITIRMDSKTYQACEATGFKVSLRFVWSRVPMRAMHYAVDQLELDVLFPDTVSASTTTEVIPSSSEVQSCLEVLKKSELNDCQVQAITSMLEPSCVKIPTLVLGPFGCGKTRTLCESVKLLLQHMPSSRLLICTQSNSAARIYVEKLDEWKNKGCPVDFNMMRVFFPRRRLTTIPPVIKKYALIENGQLRLPTLAELKSCRVVVITLGFAKVLGPIGLSKGHFSHIFIDEAAQALEPESLVPLSLANSTTKVVLAGDHMQIDPPVYSDIARKYNLHLSLLERLFDAEVYETSMGSLCKVVLTENHRSCQQIMDLPSQLFYKNKLICKSKFPPGGPDFPAVKFVCVEGHEEQDEYSPSFFNTHEADKVVDQVKALTDGGVRPDDVCVLSYYKKQIGFVRQCLRKKGLARVAVVSVEDVQGRAFRAIIISTVRTSASELVSEKEAGFLNNPKLFNTAVTRAKQYLVVVGDPVTLCTMGSNRLCWLEYIRRCIGLKSFDHPLPEQFEDSLNYKMMTRQLVESTHSTFFQSRGRMQDKSQSSQKQEAKQEVQVSATGPGPRVTVVQERKEELVGGARDAAAAALKVAVHEASGATGLSSEVGASSKDSGRSVSLGKSESQSAGSIVSGLLKLSSKPTGDTLFSVRETSPAQAPNSGSRAPDISSKVTKLSAIEAHENSTLSPSGARGQTKNQPNSSSQEDPSTSDKQNTQSKKTDSKIHVSPSASQKDSSTSTFVSSKAKHSSNSKSDSRSAFILKTKDHPIINSTYSKQLQTTSSAKPSHAVATTENHVNSGRGKNSPRPQSFKIRNKTQRAGENNHVSNKSSPTAPPTDDLPPFLCNLIENFSAYSAWVESQLSSSYPLRHSQSISQNLEKHKALLEKQMEIMDDQIDLYRDLASLLRQAVPVGNTGDLSNPTAGGLSQGAYVYAPGATLSQGYGASLGALNQDMMTGAAPTSAYMPVMAAGPQLGNHFQPVSLHHHSQQMQQQQPQLVFPSALPSSYPSTFSTMGLPSTFTTYEDGSEYMPGEAMPR